MASVPSQRTARLRPDHAVRDEAVPPLEALYGPDGAGSANPVDRAGVEPSRLERHLKRRHPASRQGAGGRGEGEKDDGCGDERSWRHNPVRVRFRRWRTTP